MYALIALGAALLRVGYLLLHWRTFVDMGRDWGRVTWRYKVGLVSGAFVAATAWPIVLPLWIWHVSQGGEPDES